MTPMPTLPDSAADCRTAVLDALPRVSYRDRRHGVAAERPAPGRYLEVDDGAESLLLPLQSGTTHVGRSFAADIFLEDMSVSAGTRSSTSAPAPSGSSTTAAPTARSSTGGAWPRPSCATATSSCWAGSC